MLAILIYVAHNIKESTRDDVSWEGNLTSWTTSVTVVIMTNPMVIMKEVRMMAWTNTTPMRLR